MRIRFALLVVFALLISLAGVRSASAQATGNAQLNGTVTDPSGATVANAKITVANTATNAAYTATTNQSGFYAFTNLPPGAYELTVEASGFANYKEQFTLAVAQFSTVDVKMQIASQGEKVVVTTEAPLIEPTKTEISQVVGAQQVQDLPTSSRVFTNFALLTPGVTTSRTSLGTVFTEFEVTQISFGGMRSFSNEITVDGADFVNAASGIQRATPPQTSVQEFRVVNNSFGADYGRAIGGIVNIVTKSGGNNFHGSVYEYFQNGATDARSLLAPGASATTFAVPNTLRKNQFGVDLGGPIKKDKTFFFVNYEGNRSAQTPLFAPDLIANDAVPTGNLELIDFAKAQMGLAPEGCFNTLSACGNAATGGLTPAQAFGYLKGFTTDYNDDAGFFRIDQQVNANNRIAIRYNVEDIRAAGELVGQPLDDGGIAVPSAGRNLFTRDQSLVATWTDLLSPDVANSLVAQYARRHYFFPGATGQPDLDLANDLQFGHNFGANDALRETRAELSDTLSWVKGNHIVKFGADGNWLTSMENFPGFTPVRLIIPAGLPCMYAFSEYTAFGPTWETGGTPAGNPLLGQASGCPVAGTGLAGDTRPVDNGAIVAYAGVPVGTNPNFQSGAPLILASNGTNLNTSTWANAYPQSLFNDYSKVIDHGYWGGFIEDQWRITPKLTLNYGLRWDFESGLANYVAPDYGGWQPRVGLAYSPDSKTVLRAGFGIFDDRYNMTFFFVPNTQKTVPGYLCGNHAPANVAAACAAAGVQPQNLTFTAHGDTMAYQGYQLAGFAGATSSLLGASIIKNGGYDLLNPVSLVGTCFMGVAALHVLPGNECGIGTGGMEYNSKIPYAEQASAEIDRQFSGGFALNVGYLFVGAHRLVRGNNVNVPCPVGTSWTASELTANGGVTDPLPEWSQGMLHANGSFSTCSNGAPVTGTGALAGLGPWFAGSLGSGLQTISAGLLDYNNDVANARYNGLTVTAIERLGNYFNLTANYTYSHTIDNGNFTTFINLPVNQFNYRAEEGNSNQDQRHLLVTNFTATSPTTGAWWRKDWLFSSIITLGSGRPFTIYYGSPTLNDFAAGSVDRVGGAGVPGIHCATVATCQTMIPRNTYVGDPLYSWDLRLGRSFAIRENVKLALAVDAFNVLNRANIDQVYSIYGSPVFCGGIPKHYNDALSRDIQAASSAVACPSGGIPVPGGSVAPTPLGTTLFIPGTPTPTFGTPETMLNPRQFQFSANFTF